MAAENSTSGTGSLLGGALGRSVTTLNVPDGDAERVQLRGTLTSFRVRGIAVAPEFTGTILDSEAVEADGPDGHKWKVWGDDPFAMYASRPRTPVERELWIDRQHAGRVSSFFSVDRAHACAMIAGQMEALATKIARGPRRGARARMQSTLAVLAHVLRALTTNPAFEMSEARGWLSQVGIELPQLGVH